VDYVDNGAPAADSTFTLTVDEVRAECSGVVVLVLIDDSGQQLPEWEAGAHIDIHLPINITRQYSLCGDPQDRGRYEIAVLRDPNSRGGSDYIHAQVRKGMRFVVSHPRNNFRLRDASEYLFIAGGIGVTPLIPMIVTAQRNGVPFRLNYAGSALSRMAFVDQLGGLPETTLHVSDEGTRLDLNETLTADLPTECLVYACGPTRLLDAVSERCAQLKIANQSHVERFSATLDALDPATERAFDVELARSNQVIRVAADQTILDAVLACGIKAANSCAEGVCGSCETAVIAGDVEHRDQILDEDEKAENAVMMICCSRATSDRLVLDL
jgi:ferredoxin-NADP reductase